MFLFQRGNSAPWAGLLDGSELSNGQLISPEVSHTEDLVPSVSPPTFRPPRAGSIPGRKSVCGRRLGPLAIRFCPAGVGTGRIPDESGQAGGPRVVVGAESLVADVHLRQATVDLIAAAVEPAAEVLAVGICC